MTQLDPNYKVPEGFEPVFNYPDGHTAIPVVGECKLTTEDGDELFFDIEEIIPKLPLLDYGEIWSRGWDIPTTWAIDFNKQCWKDDAHGGGMSPTSVKHLLSEEGLGYPERREIRKFLGLPPEDPEWMKHARAAGWTPPK